MRKSVRLAEEDVDEEGSHRSEADQLGAVVVSPRVRCDPEPPLRSRVEALGLRSFATDLRPPQLKIRGQQYVEREFAKSAARPVDRRDAQH
jgi:hypothetical protein